jgi:hypothetical protein
MNLENQTITTQNPLTFESIKKRFNPEYKICYSDGVKLKSLFQLAMINSEGKIQVTSDSIEKQEQIKLLLIEKFYNLNTFEEVLNFSYQEIVELYKPIDTLDPLGLKVQIS